MIVADFKIVQSDTGPLLQGTLLTGSGLPQDLTGATVKFKMTDAAGNVIVNDATCTIIGSPLAGVVQYTWQAADTLLPGLYDGEFHVTLAGGMTITFPTPAPLKILVRTRL